MPTQPKEIRPDYWMTDLWSVIGKLPLRDITMANSHDAGISVLTRSTIGSNECNTRTQKLQISAQLQQGARCFDLRPTIWGGDWRLGHFSTFEGFAFGSTGELLNDVLTAVRDFAGSHPLRNS